MSHDAKTFWNARAREDALYFVDNRIPYRGGAEREFWDNAAPTLDGVLDAVGARVEPSDRVLDIGCGVGRLTRVLAHRAESVIGLDVAPEMLELARKYNGDLDNVTWLEGDGTSLAGVADGSVDAVVSHVVFQHIPNPAIVYGYVREIGRVLAPGGWAAFQVSNDPAVHEQAPGLRNRLTSLVKRAPRGQTHPNWQGSAVDVDDLRASVREGGMSVERLVGEGTQFCMVLTRKS